MVAADGDTVGPIEQDVGGLEDRVTEQAVGFSFGAPNVLLLFFVRRVSFEPTQGRDHAEEKVELGVLFDMGLDEDG